MNKANPIIVRSVFVSLLFCFCFAVFTAAQVEQPSGPAKMPPGMRGADTKDPRAKLSPGMYDAEEAAKGMKHILLLRKPDAFQVGTDDPDDPRVQAVLGQLGVGDTAQIPKPFQLMMAQLAFANSDLAFQGDRLFMGNFYGINIYDISEPRSAKLLTSLVCPGGQGDVSVYRNLMFMSVEMPNGRLDCGTEGFPTEPASVEGQENGASGPAAEMDRFRGVRIFDISDIRSPRQVGAVQTCRGSHTHTLLVDPNDKNNVYIYVSGTSFVRPSEELAGCSGGDPEKDPDTSLFRIEVIKVPLAAPQDARVVSTPRIFGDPKTGAINVLTDGGSHANEGRPAETNQCHDITVFPEIGLAAGACAGNGILLDIRDPVNPKRIDSVNDPNYAYWHSASFSNDGKKVVFTDEWGGGMAPRCRENDPDKWGANSIFRLSQNKLSFASYYKLSAAQSETENCVAHNGSLVPVPGRDIKVQAWYQGGISVMDFTDAANPFEIAYFDRGPIDPNVLVMGGSWSAYWYNGKIYSSEIARGLDILELIPTEFLTQNEIDAAKLVRLSELNVQSQTRTVWPQSLTVAKAYVDQLERSQTLSRDRVGALRAAIQNAEKSNLDKRSTAKLRSLATSLEKSRNLARNEVDAARVRSLVEILKRPVG
jgi:hypothetical protein